MRRADWGGMAVFGIALTTLYFALDQGNRLDWFRSGLVVIDCLRRPRFLQASFCGMSPA